ncbi:MAG TPA: hypothetical protein ENJ75_01900 [Candidatus Kaiserbacteria bacterium]|nr:hypothetical protein [Candidatus Kaiserbacteria bacterium]
MKKATSVLVLFVSILFASIASATVYDNVVYQAYRALDPSASGYSSQILNGDYVSDWNWLTSDSSYSTVHRWFGCNASDWALTGDGSGCTPEGGWVSFYTDPVWYGYTNSVSVLINEYGRGGQCVYFVNLVLYRAGAYTQALPLLSTMWNYQDISLSTAQPGYVLQRYGVAGKANHIAIIVGVTRDGSGTVTAVTVVDSNWVSDNGANMEIIAKHTILNPDPSQWRVWYGY